MMWRDQHDFAVAYALYNKPVDDISRDKLKYKCRQLHWDGELPKVVDNKLSRVTPYFNCN